MKLTTIGPRCELDAVNCAITWVVLINNGPPRFCVDAKGTLYQAYVARMDYFLYCYFVCIYFSISL